MSDTERKMVDLGFQKFLNSLNFPIEVFIQTREFDGEIVVENLHNNINNTSKRFPSIMSYANEYEKAMSSITEYINNSKIKKKYIIVSYNNTDFSDVSALTNYEIKQFALDELLTRCNIVASGLTGVGLDVKLLRKPEIAECLFSFYHRSYYRLAKDIAVGWYDSLVVDRDSQLRVSNRETLDTILLTAQNQIKSLITADCDNKVLEFYRYIWQVLEYFKQDDRSSYIRDLLESSMEKAYENGYEQEYYSYINNNQEKLKYTNFDNPDDRDDISVRYENYNR